MDKVKQSVFAVQHYLYNGNFIIIIIENGLEISKISNSATVQRSVHN